MLLDGKGLVAPRARLAKLIKQGSECHLFASSSLMVWSSNSLALFYHCIIFISSVATMALLHLSWLLITTQHTACARTFDPQLIASSST